MRCCCCSGDDFGSTAPEAVARHSSDLLFASTKSRTSVPSFFSMAWLFPPPTDTRPALPTGMPTDTPTPVEPPYVLLPESCMPIRKSGLASAGRGHRAMGVGGGNVRAGSVANRHSNPAEGGAPRDARPPCRHDREREKD